MDFARSARCLIAGLALVTSSLAAGAQDWPSRPIKFVVANAPGGPNDVMARLIAQRLQSAVGWTVVIDNRPGAGGSTATKAVAAAEPDGYTFLFGNTATLAVGPAVYANVGYDPIKQFAAVALVSVSFNVLVVNPGFPGSRVADLIGHARANPGKLNFGSPGFGTPPQMVGEMFKQRTGLDIVHVPYKGTAAVLTDIMAGEVQLTFENPSVTVPLVHDGKLKALAVTGEARNPQLPDVPTMIESGVPDFVSMSFTGLVAPAGTPPEMIARLNAEVNAVVALPDLATAMAKLGVAPRPGTPADFAAFLVRENQKWSAVARHAGIRIE